MNSRKYIGMDVHKESISIAVRNDAGTIVMECVSEETDLHSRTEPKLQSRSEEFV
jgi:hypothetical protein